MIKKTKKTKKLIKKRKKVLPNKYTEFFNTKIRWRSTNFRVRDIDGFACINYLGYDTPLHKISNFISETEYLSLHPVKTLQDTSMTYAEVKAGHRLPEHLRMGPPVKKKLIRKRKRVK